MVKYILFSKAGTFLDVQIEGKDYNVDGFSLSSKIVGIFVDMKSGNVGYSTTELVKVIGKKEAAMVLRISSKKGEWVPKECYGAIKYASHRWEEEKD